MTVRTETSIRGGGDLGASDHLWKIIKTGVTTLQAAEAPYSIKNSIPYIKQKSSKTLASGGRIYRSCHRFANLTTSTI